MKNDKRILISILWLVLGAVLVGLSLAGKVDSFWNGMGSALLVLGVVQLLRFYRLRNNAAYREKMEIEQSDERNHFIRSKAWAWAGYLFVLIAAVGAIVLRLIGEEQMSMCSSYAACLLMVLYWGSYMILRKKY